MRKIVTALILAACGSLLAACGQRVEAIGSQTDPVPANTVLITNLSFIPHRIVVTAGQTVTWKWDDGITPHNVTFSPSGPSGSGYTSSGYSISAASPTQVRGTWTHTFSVPGTYYYRCTIHENMNGIVVVRVSS